MESKVNGTAPTESETWAWNSKRRLRLLFDIKFRAKGGDVLHDYDELPFEQEFDVPEGAKADWIVTARPSVSWNGRTFPLVLSVPLGSIKADEVMRIPLDLPCTPRHTDVITFSDGHTALKERY